MVFNMFVRMSVTDSKYVGTAFEDMNGFTALKSAEDRAPTFTTVPLSSALFRSTIDSIPEERSTVTVDSYPPGEHET